MNVVKAVSTHVLIWNIEHCHSQLRRGRERGRIMEGMKQARTLYAHMEVFQRNLLYNVMY
jgi:hypothetical protein